MTTKDEALKQEPVAWMWTHTRVGKVGVYFENPAQFYDLSKPSDYEWKPLYASPPEQQEELQRLRALVRAQQITIEKLEAQQQEPVAWKDRTYGNLHHQDFGNSIPLYTSPPASKPWVGLTKEAVWSLYKNLWMFHPAEEPRLAGDILKFARAIETKLREKNA